MFEIESNIMICSVKLLSVQQFAENFHLPSSVQQFAENFHIEIFSVIQSYAVPASVSYNNVKRVY